MVMRRELNAIYVSSCVTLDKLYPLSAPQFPKLSHEDNAISPAGFLEEVKDPVQGWVLGNSPDVRFSWRITITR